MRFFVFNSISKNNLLIEDDGWKFKSKINKIGMFILSTPIQKEVTYSKGPSIRYVRHTVTGIGYLDKKSRFKGVAIFDAYIRTIIFTILLVGVGHTSDNLNIGFFWALLYYILISLLSFSEDSRLLSKSKSFLHCRE